MMTLYNFFFKKYPELAKAYRTVYRYAKKGLLDSVDLKDGKYVVKDEDLLKKEIEKISHKKITFKEV